MKNKVKVGNLTIGGGAPVVVQSMTKTDTRDTTSTLAQINRLVDFGCELVRCAVPDEVAANALKEIVTKSTIPICADIHFDYRLALLSLEAGVHKLRLNPGNIKDPEKIKLVGREAKDRHIPIRVGVNAGSLSHTTNLAQEAVDAALKEAQILEEIDFQDIVVSVKTSDIQTNIEANRLLSQRCNYPIHIGLTEAGPLISGLVRSSACILPLLKEGIGDTIRVSLTDEPEFEVEAAWALLETTNRRFYGPVIISCPNCGRTHKGMRDGLVRIRMALKGVKKIKLAVMGCEVNGPGEAKDADCGIAFGENKCAVFEKGKIIGTFQPDEAVRILVDIARRISD